jgi:1-acyl-sn-glycerol-3-phosphate acyltransferase
MPDKDRYALKDIAETAIGEIVASDSPVQPLPKK